MNKVKNAFYSIFLIFVLVNCTAGISNDNEYSIRYNAGFQCEYAKVVIYDNGIYITNIINNRNFYYMSYKSAKNSFGSIEITTTNNELITAEIEINGKIVNSEFVFNNYLKIEGKY